MRRRIWILLTLGVWICLAPIGALGQESHRRPAPPPPAASGTDEFDRMEREQQRQEREAARRERQRKRAATLERREVLRALRSDIPQLRRLLEQIETELRETDTRTELNVNLRQRADELEKLAKRTRKNIRKL